jgi:GTP-binding protein HflX
LERQRGGFGFLGGPGETQIEADRRMIRDRMARLRRELEEVKRTRSLHRARRKRAPWPVIALVGYTNAGKSTLFNALTHAGTYAADQLFATLDTTSRRMFSPAGRNIVLSDTVGFIRDLPHELVAAFRATLTETAQADVLLHVVDFASNDRERQVREVNRVLAEIGADTVPQILVCNKIDQVSIDPKVVHDDLGGLTSVSLSALTGAGVDLLRVALDDFFDRAERDPAFGTDVERDPAFEPDEEGDVSMSGLPLPPASAIVDAETWTVGPGGAATGARSR